MTDHVTSLPSPGRERGQERQGTQKTGKKEELENDYRNLKREKEKKRDVITHAKNSIATN